MIRKLSTGSKILLLLLMTSLTFHVIFGIEGRRQIAALENKVFLQEINQSGLESKNAWLEVDNDILSRRLSEYEQQAAEQQAKIYDIPLSEELQKYTFNLCEENELDYELVLAIMDQESDYQEEIISSTNDYGIMQINKVNHSWLEDKLNINDFLDVKQNILAGIYIIKDLATRYDDEHKILMAYNMGEYGAQKKWEQGITSSSYSRQVVSRANELKVIK